MNLLTLYFAVCVSGHSQQLVCEDNRARLTELGGRAASQTNIYLDSVGYRDNGFDTFSVDSSDSMETSISACSPDNVSRSDARATPTRFLRFYHSKHHQHAFVINVDKNIVSITQKYRRFL